MSYDTEEYSPPKSSSNKTKKYSDPKSFSDDKIRAGTCDFCHFRFRDVSENDGKLTCPECKSVQS